MPKTTTLRQKRTTTIKTPTTPSTPRTMKKQTPTTQTALQKQQEMSRQLLDIDSRIRRGTRPKEADVKKKISALYPELTSRRVNALYKEWLRLGDETLRETHKRVAEASSREGLVPGKPSLKNERQLQYIYDMFTPTEGPESIFPVFDMDPSWFDDRVFSSDNNKMRQGLYHLIVNQNDVGFVKDAEDADTEDEDTGDEDEGEGEWNKKELEARMKGDRDGDGDEDEDEDGEGDGDGDDTYFVLWEDILKKELVTKVKREKQVLLHLVPKDSGHRFRLRKEIQRAVDRYHKNPDRVDSVSKVPLYFVVLVGGKKRAIHMLLYILVNGQVYTLGLGYAGMATETEQQIGKAVQSATGIDYHIMSAALYSPDYLLDTDRDNKIVDMGVLTPVVAGRLQKKLQQCDHLSVELTHAGGSNNLITLNKVFLQGLPQKYNTFSSNWLSELYLNCTSFITSLLPHLRCQGSLAEAKLSPVSIPKWCEASPPWTDDELGEMVGFYQEDNVGELLARLRKRAAACEGAGCTIMGGGTRLRQQTQKTQIKRHTRRLPRRWQKM